MPLHGRLGAVDDADLRIELGEPGPGDRGLSGDGGDTGAADGGNETERPVHDGSEGWMTTGCARSGIGRRVVASGHPPEASCHAVFASCWPPPSSTPRRLPRSARSPTPTCTRSGGSRGHRYLRTANRSPTSSSP